MPYHFFPRRPLRDIVHRKKPDGTELQAGLGVLRSILFHGLMLTPERRPFGFERSYAVPRACFTEDTVDNLSAREVPVAADMMCNHFELFGPFAIGIDKEMARKLGMNPVLYMATGGGEYTAFADVIADGVRKIHNVLMILSHLESRANPDHDATREIGWALPRERLGEPGVDFVADPTTRVEEAMGLIDTLPPQEAKRFEEIFANDGRPFWQLAEHTMFLLDIMQDVDSSRAVEKRPLAYYRQREWRLLAIFHGDVIWVPLSEAGVVQQAFRDRRVNDHVSARDWLLAGKGAQPFCSMIDEIIFPDCCRESIDQLVRELAAAGRPFAARLTPYKIEDKFA
jgi:hypothetical protein